VTLKGFLPYFLVNRADSVVFRATSDNPLVVVPDTVVLIPCGVNCFYRDTVKVDARVDQSAPPGTVAHITLSRLNATDEITPATATVLVTTRHVAIVNGPFVADSGQTFNVQMQIRDSAGRPHPVADSMAFVISVADSTVAAIVNAATGQLRGVDTIMVHWNGSGSWSFQVKGRKWGAATNVSVSAIGYPTVTAPVTLSYASSVSFSFAASGPWVMTPDAVDVRVAGSISVANATGGACARLGWCARGSNAVGLGPCGDLSPHIVQRHAQAVQVDEQVIEEIDALANRSLRVCIGARRHELGGLLAELLEAEVAIA
jgi:hypothetical protein